MFATRITAAGITSVLLALPALSAPAARFAGPYQGHRITAAHLASGDLNGDGREDLVTETAVYLANGDGFTPVATHAAATHTPLLADLDGDGRLDLVSIVAGYAGLVVRHGDGDGGWGPELRLASPRAVSGVVAADLDHDGRVDLAAAGSDSVHLWHATGARSYRRVALGSCSYSVGIAAADFDGDGRHDLAVACRSGNSGSVSVHLADGAGAFRERADHPAGGPAFGVIPHDAEGDGDLDLVVRGDVRNRLLANDGSGRFAGSIDLRGRDGAVADFDGDGHEDLALAPTYWGEDHVAVLLRQGEHRTPALPRANYVLTAGDFGGDGHVDLALAAGTSVLVFDGNGDGTFGPPGWTPTGLTAFYTSTMFADFDGDGRLDVTCFDGQHLIVAMSDGAGGFRMRSAFVSAERSSVLGLDALDANGDGRLDLVLAVQRECGYRCYRTSLHLALNRGDGFGPAEPVPHQFDATKLAAGDADGDGRADVVGWTRDAVSGYWVVKTLRNRGDGTFDPPLRSWLTERLASPGATRLGDLDGDGRSDLVIAAGWFPGLGGGLFGGLVAWPSPLADVRSIVLADVDGDERLDVVEAAGSWVRVRRSGGAPIDVTGALGVPIAVGDFDGDGMPDLASGSGGAVSFPTLVTGLTSLHVGNGDGTFRPAQIVGGAHGDLAFTDLDADGRADLLSLGAALRNLGPAAPPIDLEPRVTVLFPNGGEQLSRDQTLELRWTSHAPRGGAVVGLRVVDQATGASVELAAGLPSEGTFSWRPGARFAGQYRLHATLRDRAGREADDTSDAAFHVLVTSGDLDPARQALTLQVTPNPASARAEIAFSLPASSPVRLTLHDLSGRELTVLIDGTMEPGLHRTAWSGHAGDAWLAPGVYFVRLWTPAGTRTRRVAVIR